MSFSEEWDKLYRQGKHKSVWPWSDLISLVSSYGSINTKKKILELGCGAGANIPYFISCGMDYYGIDGSEFEIEEIREKFKEYDNVYLQCADFTKEIPFDGPFDLIVDRAALTHNSSADIQKCIGICSKILSDGGIYIGVDWMSTDYDVYLLEKDYTSTDGATRLFQSGHFKGMGNIHFSTPKEIVELFEANGMNIIHLYEKRYDYLIPENKTQAQICFVAKK